MACDLKMTTSNKLKRFKMLKICKKIKIASDVGGRYAPTDSNLLLHIHLTISILLIEIVRCGQPNVQHFLI